MESRVIVTRLKTSVGLLRGAVVALYAPEKSPEVLDDPGYQPSLGMAPEGTRVAPMTKQIVEVCKVYPGINTRGIMSYLHLPKEKESSLRTTLSQLTKRGKLRRMGYGKYGVAA